MITDSNFNDVINNHTMKHDVCDLQSVARSRNNGELRSHSRDFSLIDDDRLSKLDFEENERLCMQEDVEKVINSNSMATVSNVPTLNPASRKSILKHSKASKNTKIPSSWDENVSAEKVKSALPLTVYPHSSGLEYLEQTIREADEAVRHSMTDMSEDYRQLHCIDIDIGESRAVHGNYAAESRLDKMTGSTNTHLTSSDNRASGLHEGEDSNNFTHNGGHDVCSQSHFNSASAPSSDNVDIANLASADALARSSPADPLIRSVPNVMSPPEYRMAMPVSPTDYQMWTSSALPLQSPADSPKHRMSQSGSPISPASGHQTIVYVPIITNNCSCCNNGHRADSLHDMVGRRRRSSTREDDQISIASSMDSEVARYLVDYRGEAGLHVDVMESRNSVNLKREDRIQRAILERKRNFLRKRLERANKAEGEARMKKGKHESFGFGSSAPRFEDIILTSSPGTRSMSQLNLSAMRKSATSGDEADQAPITRAKSTELPDNLKKSVARLSVARSLQAEPLDKNKSKPSLSASHTNLSSVSKPRPPRSPPIELIKSQRPDRQTPLNAPRSTAMGSRSMTTGDISKLGLSHPRRSSDTNKKPAVGGSTDHKPRAKPSDLMTKSASSDIDSSSSVKSSLKSRSSSATRNSSLTKSAEEATFESRSKTLDRPSKAQRAAKAEAMSKSMCASTSLVTSAADAVGPSRMRKARSVGNISRAHLGNKKEVDSTKQAPTRAPLAKSKSTDPVKPVAPKKTSTPNKMSTSSKPAVSTGSKLAASIGKSATPTNKAKPASKAAMPGGSRRASKDSNSGVSPKGTRSTTPTAEIVAKPKDTKATGVVEAAAENDVDVEKSTEGEVGTVSVTAPSPKEESKRSAKDAEMEEYKAKLAEKRREAREKAEKEAEEERQRQEQERLADEQRLREEEERQREFELEQNRLMAEARQQEQERLEKAIEDEERRRKEEAERMESERLAKEEAAEKSRLDAEKKEKEKQERIAKEEQEKLERKKKLEMIMKRVKTGSPTPDRPQATSEPASLSTSMTGSMTSSSPVPSTSSGSFKSPLLQGLMANKSETTSEKKFSSPLLNNLMAKVSADRSDDNSSNSSASNTPSQPNSSQTSPEHKTVAPQHTPTDQSELSVEIEGDNSAFLVYMKEDNLTNLDDELSGKEMANHSVQSIGSANELQGDNVEILTNNVNGNASTNVTVENGLIPSTQNGISHSLQTNDNGSAGITDEEHGAFEEVLNLSSKQSQVPSANPAPFIAFDDSSAHTEGGDTLHAANTPRSLLPVNDQKFTSGELSPVSLLQDESWSKLDQIMMKCHGETLTTLAGLGIAEGNQDDESDEGQIWQMVEGRLPYTLDMV
ncbi:MAP7 domain-containing protein 1-like isoform X8 [Watersipora subatra]|uniref:MAP7 domain-containing protein 1-like isoform X8 n=1 Tax=Watersipora subatra TaxID=2589382 RepID=UPI00355C4EDF